MSSTECILIHDNSPKNYYAYFPLVTYYGDQYTKVYYYCPDNMLETVKFMYRALNSIEVRLLESEDVLTMFNFIRKKHGRQIPIFGFGDYDMLRTDKYKGEYRRYELKSQSSSALDFGSICELYGLNDIDITQSWSIERDTTRERVFFTALIKYVNFEYTVVSQDRFKNDEGKTVTVVNALRMFPKNKNLFNLLTLIDNASLVILGNDPLGMFLYFLVTSKNYKKSNITFYCDSSTDLSYFKWHVVPNWNWKYL